MLVTNFLKILTNSLNKLMSNFFNFFSPIENNQNSIKNIVPEAYKSTLKKKVLTI